MSHRDHEWESRFTTNVRQGVESLLTSSSIDQVFCQIPVSRVPYESHSIEATSLAFLPDWSACTTDTEDFGILSNGHIVFLSCSIVPAISSRSNWAQHRSICNDRLTTNASWSWIVTGIYLSVYISLSLPWHHQPQVSLDTCESIPGCVAQW